MDGGRSTQAFKICGIASRQRPAKNCQGSIGSMSADESFLRQEVEPYIDTLYLQSPLLKRHCDSAAIHLLRTFEDASRFGTLNSALKGEPIQFHTRLRWAHEAIPWALRWVWSDCPREGSRSLDLDWDVYGEAAELMQLGFKYYQLCRCFILFSRGFFKVDTAKEKKRIRFFFRSQEEQERDAASLIYGILRNDPPLPSQAVLRFLHESMPVIAAVLPHYIDKIGECSIRCETPSDVLEYFKMWAILTIKELNFDLPGTWQFGSYNLDQFRYFWASLLCRAIAHIKAHDLADHAVGTSGGAIGSLVIQVTEDWLMKSRELFPVPEEAWHSIFNLLVYQPTRNYWDPFWQPIIKCSDGTLLIAPHMVVSSSPQRNLITLLNRTSEGRKFYDSVSSQKEEEQLSFLAKLLGASRFSIRTRVPVPRKDGTTLTDIDLIAFDAADNVLLLVHAKWLIGPDTVQEVLARDEEVQTALRIAVSASSRISELGVSWIGAVLNENLKSPPVLHSIVVNQDFVPSGWVYDKQVPIVITDFVVEFARSAEFKGLASLYTACAGFSEHLKARHPVKHCHDEIQFGEYTFEHPTLEPINHP